MGFTFMLPLLLACALVSVLGAERAPLAPKLQFRGLQAADFAHPTDLQLTRQLQSNPLIADVIRRVVEPLEKAYVADNLASAVLVGEKQLPRLFASLEQAASTLNVPAPDLYVRQNAVPNAYTLAIRGRKPFIVLHSAIIDLLSEEELQAVLAHELGHLKCEHGVAVTLLNLLMLASESLLRSSALSIPLRSLLLEWQRSAEYSCDRAALLVAQDVQVVASVFMKLAGGKGSSQEMAVDSFIHQAVAYEEISRSGVGRLLSFGRKQMSTHPEPVIRAREIVKWGESPAYAGILARAKNI